MTSTNILEKLKGRFPVSQIEKVITFCGGYKCGKSHKVANKLVAKGYKDVSVFAGGLPQWKESGLGTTKSSAVKSEVKEEKQQRVFWLQPNFKYIAAASLVFILSLTIWLQNSVTESTNTNFELLSFSDDVLVNSLLINENELEAFADATLMNEVIIKAELSEQKMDNLFLNSLFVEDSLIDNYTDKNLIDAIIL